MVKLNVPALPSVVVATVSHRPDFFTCNSTGTFDYRAVVADLPGYLQFGYSPAQPLKVTG